MDFALLETSGVFELWCRSYTKRGTKFSVCRIKLKSNAANWRSLSKIGSAANNSAPTTCGPPREFPRRGGPFCVCWIDGLWEAPISGTVLTFTNVTAFRASIDQAIYEREYAKTILNTVADPLVVLDGELHVLRTVWIARRVQPQRGGRWC